MASIKITTTKTMHIVTIKAFGFYANMSFGRSSVVKAAKANAKAYDRMVEANRKTLDAICLYGEWTVEGYERHAEAMALKALEEVARDACLIGTPWEVVA